MYARAGSAFRSSLSLFGGFAVLLMMVDVLLPPPVDWPVTLLLTGALAFFCHRMILLDEAHTWTGMFHLTQDPKIGPGPFLLRFLLLSLLFGGLALVLDLSTGSVAPDLQPFIVLALLLPYGLILAWFGTLLPAAVMGVKLGPSEAFARGRPARGRTLMRLILGPLLFGVLTATLGALAEQAILNMALSGRLGGPGLTLGIRSLQFCMALATCFVTLLAATALSLAFQETDRASG